MQANNTQSKTRLIKFKPWFAAKYSGEPPLGFTVISVRLNKAKMFRYPRWLRRLIGFAFSYECDI